MIKRCIVPGCTNTSDAGLFIGDVCAACHPAYHARLRAEQEAEALAKAERVALDVAEDIGGDKAEMEERARRSASNWLPDWGMDR